MDLTPIIAGMLIGCAVTLLIQAYGRRKAGMALARAQSATTAAEPATVIEMRKRIAVLEQIITDRPRLLEREIETLR